MNFIERVEFVRDIPVYKLHPVSGQWHDHSFPKNLAYEIVNRQTFMIDDFRSYFQFELWDNEGYIGSYRIKIEVWNESVKMLEIKETAQ